MQKKISNNKRKNTDAASRLPMLLTAAVLAVLVVLVVLMNLCFPITYTMYETDTIEYEKGTGTAI